MESRLFLLLYDYELNQYQAEITVNGYLGYTQPASIYLPFTKSVYTQGIATASHIHNFKSMYPPLII